MNRTQLTKGGYTTLTTMQGHLAMQGSTPLCHTITPCMHTHTHTYTHAHTHTHTTGLVIQYSKVHEMQVPRAVGTTQCVPSLDVKWGGSVSSPCLTVLGGHIIPTTKYALVYSKHYTHSLDSNLEL